MTSSSPGIPRRDLLVRGGSALALPGVFAAPSVASADGDGAVSNARGLAFDTGWRFHRGMGDFQSPGIDDAAWRLVDLPHDWGLEDLPAGAAAGGEGPFDPAAIGGTATGFTIGGEGWYRKSLNLESVAPDARVELVFDGASVVSEVWINGRSLGSHPNGYTPFVLELTPHLVRDGSDLVAVRVRNLGRNSRWYAGSGLYRSVRLDITPPGARLVRWGVAAWTRSIEDGSARIALVTEVEAPEPGLQVRTRLIAPGGEAVAVSSDAAGRVDQTLVLADACLWSPDDPRLYSLETALIRAGSVVDSLTQTFGVRIIAMDAANGLTINGRPLRLRGGCLHHDNGLLGAAAFADADDRRVRLLRARGFNAVRSAHNPASTTFLEACDRHGMLVIEEAFDSWRIAKKPDDYSTVFAERWESDLQAMVRSARNHPSVFMWSIGNEIPERNTAEGVDLSWRLSNALRRLDPTRPVTAGLQEFLGRPVVAAEGVARAGEAGKLDQPSTVFLDVAGYNYKIHDIEADHADWPDRILYASESYASEAFAYRTLVERAPYFLGEFVWTAMDYVGEAGLGLAAVVPDPPPPYLAVSWPVINAYCGDLDLIGGQKPQSLYRDVVWGLSSLEMTVQRPLPAGQVEKIPLWGWSDELVNWSWPGREGETVSVRLYSPGDRVDLFLDGRSAGSVALGPDQAMRASLDIPYSPGVLEAVAWRDGVEIGRRRIETVGAADAVILSAETVLARERGALCYVTIGIADDQGRPVVGEEQKVALEVTGPAELIALGSGAPMATGSLRSNRTRTWQGRALAILRSTGGPGAVQLSVACEGLRPARVTVTPV